MRRAKSEQSGGENQHYGTPAWCVRRLLDHHPLPVGRWLELGVGRGAIVRAVREYTDHEGHAYAGVDWLGVEIDPVLADVARATMAATGARGDVRTGSALYLLVEEPHVSADSFDVAIMNPPNDRAEAFVEAALALAPLVFVLQPLQFYASSTREEFWRECPPSDVLVLPDRPSFDGTGNPMQVYCWYVFERRRFSKPRPTTIARLGLTPKAERDSDTKRFLESLQAEASSKTERAPAPPEGLS